MRLDEIKYNPMGDEISLTQFRKIMNMIKHRGLDSDKRGASIKNRILAQWDSGNHSIKKLQPDFEKLGLNLKSVIGEMEE